ncbi:hypothetical protein J2X06_003390 [Lysobacter niastensis]|uniref:Uncharacterized protein n=1 Tax=Lysobacter niastensis TaxID=380629 RepID=A0ABU1WFK8_9GAMM|nr:hypothetical protein [Lysobacter niastensis]MDR7136172.1 hypothetical protein [Lysobacter niastensis]
MNCATTINTRDQIEVIDAADKLIYQAQGVLSLICVAGSGDKPRDDAVPGATWVLQDLLDELKELIHTAMGAEL